MRVETLGEQGGMNKGRREQESGADRLGEQ